MEVKTARATVIFVRHQAGIICIKLRKCFCQGSRSNVRKWQEQYDWRLSRWSALRWWRTGTSTGRCIGGGRGHQGVRDLQWLDGSGSRSRIGGSAAATATRRVSFRYLLSSIVSQPLTVLNAIEHKFKISWRPATCLHIHFHMFCSVQCFVYLKLIISSSHITNNA